MDDEKFQKELEYSVEIALTDSDLIKTCPIAGEKICESACNGCRYKIDAPQYLDCALIAGAHGPHDVDQIARCLDIADSEVYNDINKGLLKLRKAIMKPENKQFRKQIEKNIVRTKGLIPPDGSSD